MKDEELVKMFNPTLKRKETILFLLIVVINGLMWIKLDIGLDVCARGRCTIKENKNRDVLGKERCSFWWSFGLDTVEDKFFKSCAFISFATRTTSTLSWILEISFKDQKSPYSQNDAEAHSPKPMAILSHQSP